MTRSALVALVCLTAVAASAAAQSPLERRISIHAHNVSLRDSTAIGTIVNDDFPPRLTGYGLSPKVFRAASRGAVVAVRPVGASSSGNWPASAAAPTAISPSGRPTAIVSPGWARMVARRPSAGAFVVGVATGRSSEAELRDAGADLVLADLSQPAALLRRCAMLA